MSQTAGNQAKSVRELDIIIADDARAQRWLLREILSCDGHRIRLASDGKQAFDLASETPPDLVVTDLEMAGGDGFKLIQSIRNSDNEHLRRIPVIVCSSCGDRSSLNRALDMGATSFVTKPLHQCELRMAINNLLHPECPYDD